jgi:hypothetical protein
MQSYSDKVSTSDVIDGLKKQIEAMEKNKLILDLVVKDIRSNIDTMKIRINILAIAHIFLCIGIITLV